jgi:hypothetical protein
MDRSEVVLDNDLLDRLSSDAAGRSAPHSGEVHGNIVSRSTEALDAGHFQVVLHPWSAEVVAGATFGRFTYLLGEPAEKLGRQMYGDLAEVQGIRPVHLSWRAKYPCAANIAQTPRWLAHQMVVGGYADRRHPGTLSLDDIAVAASLKELSLVSRSLNREVAFVPTHRLNFSLAPNAVRLLAEITARRTATQLAWNWEGLEILPYLPSVRHGRTTLSQARWRLVDPVLHDHRLDFADWCREVERWRARWRVPARVVVGRADHRLELDLDTPLHARLLRRELSRGPDVVLSDFVRARGCKKVVATTPQRPPSGFHPSWVAVPVIPTL